MDNRNNFGLENISIDEKDMPNVISEMLQNISDIDRRIKSAEIKCEKALQLSNNQVSWKASKSKESIASTQDSVRAIADTQISVIETQRQMLTYQEKFAEGMRYLLVLGTSSIAMNRMVIAELEGKLRRASQEELSQKAKEELIGVIRLLREQENAFSKQDKLSLQLDEAQKTLDLHSEELARFAQFNKAQSETDIQHDARIAELIKQNLAMEKRIEEQAAQINKIKTVSIFGLCAAIIALAIAIIGIFFI